MSILKRRDIGSLRHISNLWVLVLLLALVAGLGSSTFVSPTAARAQVAQNRLLDRHHPLVREAIETKNRHMGNLMRIPDVVGTGVGIGPDGVPAIKVFTARHGVRGIPEWLDSTPVQVEVTGMAVALGVCPQGNCGRPSPIGVSTGHPLVTAGTIGARVIDPVGNVYALSNNHVYANSNNAQIGDSALQPGTYDGGEDPTDKIGELYAFQPINFSIFGSNTIDAAIASTTTDMLGTSTLLPAGYGTPNSDIFDDLNPKDGFFDNENDLLELNVKKFGRTTGLTHGRITEINVTITVCYANCSSPFFAKLAWFDDQIGISNMGTPFSGGGDSGSLIVTDDVDNKNYPVGLLFAGSDTKTYANRIDLVLNGFGVQIDDSPTPLPPPPPPPEPPIAPSNLSASAASRTRINLKWTDNSTNELGFKIERCQDIGATACKNFVQIATVGANTKSYANTGLTRNTTYRYQVRAYNAGGDSGYSNAASAKTLR